MAKDPKKSYSEGWSETELRERANVDGISGTAARMGLRLREDVGSSFDFAYKKLRGGKPLLFITKTGGVALGAALMADGVYQMVAGADENVEDLLLREGKPGSNYVRMFAGGFETLTGAALAYIAATKGPRLRG